MEVVVKSEPIDPLIMDLEEEMPIDVPRDNLGLVMFYGHLGPVDSLLIFSQDPVTDELSLSTFKLPRSRPISQKQRALLVDSCLQRVQRRGQEYALLHNTALVKHPEQRGKPTPDMWTLLLVRMITRGATSNLNTAEADEAENEGDEDKDETDGSKDEKSLAKSNKDAALDQEYRMRRILFEYIMSDFISRFVYSFTVSLLCLRRGFSMKIPDCNTVAKRRMEQRSHPTKEVPVSSECRPVSSFNFTNNHQRVNYDYWSKEILLAAADRSDKDSFSKFVLDLPELSEGLFDLLRDLAADKARYAYHMFY
jgi:symplekin